MVSSPQADEIKTKPWVMISQCENLFFPPFRGWVIVEDNIRGDSHWRWGLQHNGEPHTASRWFNSCEGIAVSKEKAHESVIAVLSVAVYVMGLNDSGR